MPAKSTSSPQPGSRTYSIDKKGFYGNYGGRFAPEILNPALDELEQCFKESRKDRDFLDELEHHYRSYIGRPTPLTYCENLTRELGGAKVYLKNEGLAHTGAHKINHCVGQVLIARRMKKSRIIAETGAGQHGLATSSVCAKFGLECVVYMGAEDMARQRPNVFWMETLGTTVVPVEFGGKRLKDAVNAAMKDWISSVRDSHYLIGSCLGPHPFPEMNRFFQSVIGKEIRAQMRAEIGRDPHYVIACVGGGSNAAGAFDIFLKAKNVQLIGVEAGGQGIKKGRHAARFQGGRVGVVEGYKSYWLQDQDGQILDTQSVSAGLDYAGVGPLHAFLKDLGRVQYTFATDKEVIKAVKLLARTEGIISSLESAHALAEAIKLAPKLSRSKTIVVNLSGRGDKDLFLLARAAKDRNFERFAHDYRIDDE